MANDLEVEVEEETPVLAPEEPEEVVSGSVIYEQDLRAASHRNGRASDLVDPEVGGGSDLPPGLPDEPSFGRKPERRGGPTGAYVLAIIYLVAGTLSLYVGVTMLRDLRGGKKGENP